MEATLVKWGNSQGVRIPKEACDELQLELGARGTLEVDAEGRKITISFEEYRPSRKYRRRSFASLEDLAQDWDGGRIGEEWGGMDVGYEGVA